MERARRKASYVNLICTISVLGAFAIASLVLASIGVRVYKNIVEENANNYKLRTSLSYVATKVRQMDEEGCIYIEKREGVDVLVLNENIDGVQYETLLYYYEGKLYEVFHQKGGEFTLSQGGYGYEITEVNGFSMVELNNNLMRFTAVDGSGREESITLNIKSRR